LPGGFVQQGRQQERCPQGQNGLQIRENNLQQIKKNNKKQVYPTNEDQPVLHVMHVSPTNEDHMLVYCVGICFSLRRGHMFNFNAFVKNGVAFTPRLAAVVNRYALSLAAEAVDGKPNAPTVFLISHTRCVITNVVAGSEGRNSEALTCVVACGSVLYIP